MNNIIFCLDDNYLKYLKNVLETLYYFNDLKKYNFYFVIYKNNKEIHDNIIDIAKNISEDFNIFYKYHEPDDDFKNLINKYTNMMFDNEDDKTITVYNKYANWNRFFIHKIFPKIKTGLYLDLDILIIENLDEIFNTNISDNIIGIVPYNDTSIYNHLKHFFKINKNAIKIDVNNFDNTVEIRNNYLQKKITDSQNLNILLNELNINILDLNKNSYNCGIIYFNFEMFKKEKILDKIIFLLKTIVEKNLLIFKTGTEKTMNLLIYNYIILDKKFNVIFNEKYFNKYNIKNCSIIHFKGQKNLLEYKYYQDAFKLIKKKYILKKKNINKN